MNQTLGSEEKIQKVLRKFDGLDLTGELLWRVSSQDGSVAIQYGNQDKPFFIASATKLFVTAMLAQLKNEGLIDWDRAISQYLPNLDLSNLSTNSSDDFGQLITIREVMAHTSGLPDYFEGKQAKTPTTIERAIRSDFAWNLSDVLEWSRAMKPVKRGNGLYSDTGYQLLGAVIEQIDGITFSESVRKRIAGPLGLSSTYVFDKSTINNYPEIAQMLNGKSKLNIPLAMSSVQADGGIVSTVDEASRFLEAFFSGALFPKEILKEIATSWHPVFPPLEYGSGIMRFKLPALMTGLRDVPEFIGHSGASGTVMFHSPKLGLSVVGTVNQIQKRSLPFNLMIQCALLLPSK
jgi:CubicO group peptidase (beta-lactamase class C family)